MTAPDDSFHAECVMLRRSLCGFQGWIYFRFSLCAIYYEKGPFEIIICIYKVHIKFNAQRKKISGQDIKKIAPKS